MRKILVCILLIGLLFNLTVSGYAMQEKFSDVTGHWAETTINDWKSMSLINGYPDGSFKPNGEITKAEFITLVNRIFGYYVKTEENYKDVLQEDWFSSHTAIARINGYMSWYNEEKLIPNSGITRQEVSAILVTIMELKTSEDTTALENFIDSGTVPQWSEGYINAIVSSGYMKGYPDKTIRVEGKITRAEAIVMLDRIIGRLIKEASTIGPKLGTETIESNVTVNVANTTLRNLIIKGDLILAAGIGDGDVNLNNIQVEGRTIINGGGENSVKITGSKMGDIIVFRVGGKIRIVSKDSEIGKIIQNSIGKLEGKFKDCEIIVLTEDLTLDGYFKDISIEIPVELKITEGTKIENLVVKKEGEGTTIILEKSTRVDEITFESGCTVKGEGTITKANVNSNGVIVEQLVETVNVAQGVDGSGVKEKEVIPTPVPRVKISTFENTAVTDTTANFIWTAARYAYSIKIEQSIDDGITWTDTTTGNLTSNANEAIVTNLKPNTDYEFRLLVTGGRNAGYSNIVSVKTNYPPLTGKANIDNINPKFGETLTASLVNTNNTGTLSYQWIRNGIDISDATNNLYTIIEDDINTVIAVKISSTNETGTMISNNTNTVIKAENSTVPLAPTLVSKTDTSVTLDMVTGNEYSINNTVWQNEVEFTSLTPNTEYTFYQRIKETSTHNSSVISLGLNVTTNHPPLTGVVVINNTNPKFGETLTASLVNTNNTGTLSYQWIRNGIDISNATNNVYTIIEDDINTVIAVKISSTNETGTMSSDNTNTVIKAENSTVPLAPTLVSKTDTSVTLDMVAGNEYSINSTVWQDGVEFTSLTPNTEYTFYQRVKETSTHNSSVISLGLNVTTDYPTATIFIADYTNNKIVGALTNGKSSTVLIENVDLHAYCGPMAIDVIGDKIYFSTQDSKNIKRANLDGSQVEIVVSTGTDNVSDIAIDEVNSIIYWADYDSNKIISANLDGSNIKDVITNADASVGTTYKGPLALTISGDKLYWVGDVSGHIEVTNLDGTNRMLLVDTDSSIQSVSSIVIDEANDKIYWSDYESNSIMSANLSDGTNITAVITNADKGNSFIGVTKIELYGDYIYWNCESNVEIRRAKLDGTDEMVVYSPENLTSISGFDIQMK